MIHVTITFKDDKTEEFLCNDAPTVGNDFTVIFLESGGKKILRSERIAQVDYVNVCDTCHKKL